MADPPRVWVLLGKGAGGNAQMRLVADALGWPCVEKHLVYNSLEWLPNWLRGATRIGLDVGKSDPLEPPWPDVVLGASRRSASVSRYLRERCGSVSVHLLHVQAPLRHFDLVATLPQYRLPERPNVLHLAGALNRISEADLAAAAARWEPEFKHLPRPWIGVIVGGNSSSYSFDVETAARLAREAAALARREGGSLLISTTPRTPVDSTASLFSEIDVPAYRYAFAPNDENNPYHGFLALADRFIVTVDSASLPIEACQTGRPVQVFEWPRKRARWLSFLGRTPSSRTLSSRGARLSRVAGRAYETVIAWGLVKPARDFDTYHRLLRERGLTTLLGEEQRAPVGMPDDLGILVARVRGLVRARGARRDGTVPDVG